MTISQSELQDIAAGVGEILRPIIARVAALEQKLEEGGAKSLLEAYAGTWKPDAQYLKGQLLTDGGHLWLVRADSSAGERPAKSPAFVMIVKAGKDGKDARGSRYDRSNGSTTLDVRDSIP